MRPDAEEWLKQAKYNLQDARAMLRSRRYLFAAFASQLAVEKVLKAVMVERTATPPPRTHNLIELAKIGQENSGESFLSIISMKIVPWAEASGGDLLLG